MPPKKKTSEVPTKHNTKGDSLVSYVSVSAELDRFRDNIIKTLPDHLPMNTDELDKVFENIKGHYIELATIHNHLSQIRKEIYERMRQITALISQLRENAEIPDDDNNPPQTNDESSDDDVSEDNDIQEAGAESNPEPEPESEAESDPESEPEPEPIIEKTPKKNTKSSTKNVTPKPAPVTAPTQKKSKSKAKSGTEPEPILVVEKASAKKNDTKSSKSSKKKK